MSLQSKSLLLSLALHGGFIFFAITISGSYAHLPKPVVIDFTVLDGTGDFKPSGTKNTAGDSPAKATPAKFPVKTEKAAPAQPQAVQAVTAPAIAESVPATESMSTVAVAALPGDSASQARQETEGGAGTERGQSASGSASGSGNARAWSGGAAGSTEQMKSRYAKEHFEYIKKLIESSMAYPPRARRLGWTGRVLVSFSIMENGRITNEKVVSSSGYDLLDDNVLETVRRVQPFPKPPVRAELKIPITYHLD